MVTIDSKKEETEPKEPDENNPSKKTVTKKKKTVVIGARIHPGETPSSYVCQGIYFLFKKKFLSIINQ